MRVDVSTPVQFKITGATRLDPINVIFQDFEPGQGKVTIECYGKAWSAYWGAMGDRNVSQFFCSCDEYYLVGCLAGGLRELDEDGNPDPQHEYLCRIIRAVQEAFRTTEGGL